MLHQVCFTGCIICMLHWITFIQVKETYKDCRKGKETNSDTDIHGKEHTHILVTICIYIVPLSLDAKGVNIGMRVRLCIPRHLLFKLYSNGTYTHCYVYRYLSLFPCFSYIPICPFYWLVSLLFTCFQQIYWIFCRTYIAEPNILKHTCKKTRDCWGY